MGSWCNSTAEGRHCPVPRHRRFHLLPRPRPPKPPGRNPVQQVHPTTGLAVPPARMPLLSFCSAATSAPAHDPTNEQNRKKTSWIEIELVDEEGNPVSGEPYRVTLADGITVADGTLDEKGFARVDHIDPGTCKVSFAHPRRGSLGKAKWVSPIRRSGTRCRGDSLCRERNSRF